MNIVFSRLTTNNGGWCHVGSGGRWSGVAQKHTERERGSDIIGYANRNVLPYDHHLSLSLLHVTRPLKLPGWNIYIDTLYKE